MNVQQPISSEPKKYGKLPANEAYSVDPYIAESAVEMLRLAGLDPSRLRAWECCAGRGDLMRNLMRYGLVNIIGSDIEDHEGRYEELPIKTGVDVMTLAGFTIPTDTLDLIITNTIFTHPICEKMLTTLVTAAPEQWLAFFVPRGWLEAKSSMRRALFTGGRLHLIAELGRRCYLVAPNENEEHLGSSTGGHLWILFRPASHPFGRAIHDWLEPRVAHVKLTPEARAKRRKKGSKQ